MKAILFFLFVTSIPQLPSIDPGIDRLALNNQDALRIMTFNIRYNNPNDGEHAWPNRKERVASVIRFHGADIIGMQEVLKGQIEDLETLLPGYTWFGVGRDDGVDSGEFSPVFYRTERFELLESGTFWLSESPAVAGSKSWDAALTRIASWGKFRDRITDKTFLHLNTHFDHRGEQARTESAGLIVNTLDSLADGNAVIVTGDFNVNPSTDAYGVMTGALSDSRLTSLSEPHGPEATFAGFTVDLDESGDRIDYIFVDDSISVLSHGVISDQWNGHYPSDHLPVISEIVLP